MSVINKTSWVTKEFNFVGNDTHMRQVLVGV